MNNNPTLEQVREAIHIVDNSQLVSGNYTREGLCAAYVLALAALRHLEAEMEPVALTPYQFLGETTIDADETDNDEGSICIVRCTKCGWRMYGDGWCGDQAMYRSEQIPYYCGHCGAKFGDEWVPNQRSGEASHD